MNGQFRATSISCNQMTLSSTKEVGIIQYCTVILCTARTHVAYFYMYVCVRRLWIVAHKLDVYCGCIDSYLCAMKNTQAQRWYRLKFHQTKLQKRRFFFMSTEKSKFCVWKANQKGSKFSNLVDLELVLLKRSEFICAVANCGSQDKTQRM